MAIPTSHSTELYTLGSGVLEIAEIVAGVTGGYVDVGNCPRFEVELTEETTVHRSSRTASRKRDKSAIIETGYNLNFDLDELSMLNMKMFFKASQSGEDTLYANMNAGAEYALRFTSDNAEGPNYQIDMWRVKLGPGGNMGLISDDWVSMSFTGEGLADETNHPESPHFTMVTSIESLITTTTTTTAP